MRSFAETSRELFFQLSRAGEILAVSPAGGKMHGPAPEQYLEQYRGCHYLDCINPDEHSLVGKSFDLLLSGARNLEIVVQLMSGDNRRIRAEIQAAPWREGEKIVGVQGTIREVASPRNTGRGRRVRERDLLCRNAGVLRQQLIQAEKLRVIGSLAGSIAHEFNNPLCGVRSVVERMARKSELAVAEQGLLELALEQCDRMKRLIRNLQQFNPSFPDARKNFELHPAIDSVLLLLNKHLKIRKTVVRKEYAAGNLRLTGVENQIKQVLLILIKNSGEAMLGAGGEIRVSTRRDQHTVYIAVSGTGVAISPEHLPHIFEPFFTLQTAAKETEIGLAVAYGIIKGHQGEIQVESIPDRGTTFTVILPAGNTEDNEDIK